MNIQAKAKAASFQSNQARFLSQMEMCSMWEIVTLNYKIIKPKQHYDNLTNQHANFFMQSTKFSSTMDTSSVSIPAAANRPGKWWQYCWSSSKACGKEQLMLINFTNSSWKELTNDCGMHGGMPRHSA